jgi:NADH-quinone oxidoreductase subunit J
MNGSDVFGNPPAVGKLLFSNYLLPFEVTSILLLVAIMGAVVLARREGD